MSAGEALLIALAGVGAGLTGSMAGLASLVSYPALLASGLPPLAANVTNTTALLGNAVGTTAGSLPELTGQWRRVRTLMVLCATGGAIGAALLLLTDEAVFEEVVPWLVALGSVLLMARDRLRTWAETRAATSGSASARWRGHAVVGTVGVYGGYFGAGAGVIMLAVLALRTSEPLAVTNAVKNVATSTANLAAALAYAVLAPVDWTAVLVLGSGALVGGWIGPQVVRVLPERPLRWGIAVAGLGLAAYLLLS